METILIDEPLNVFGEVLLPCSEDPLTGFLRDGCCNTNDQDVGSHTVCIQVTEAFLQYSRFAGNDLSTPMPEYGFPGLKPGDRWCLCAGIYIGCGGPLEYGYLPANNAQYRCGYG